MAASSRRFRARPPAKLGREEAIRDVSPRVLIVCEGECTEPYYFEDLRRDFGLSNVHVAGKECGSAPISVVDYAIECYQNDPGIDQIYCVFDRDEHASFDEACFKAKTKNESGIPIELIRSVPSFEFWYILHFKFTSAPIVRSGGKSGGKNAVSVLKSEFADYEKERRDLWGVLKDRLPTAIQHAKQALGEAKAVQSDNPSTEVHILVTSLMKLMK